jgi:hypothetical protein
MTERITPQTCFTLLGGIGLAVYALFLASSYDQRILTLSGVYVILVLGYQFIFGHAGALSLAQGAFFGIGAYVTGILGSQFGAGFVLTFPLSIAGAAVIAAIVAVPVLRLQTHYFALATLALSQLLFLIGVNWESVTGGANGLSGVPGITLGDWRFTRGLPLLAIVWAIAGDGDDHRVLADDCAACAHRGLHGHAGNPAGGPGLRDRHRDAAPARLPAQRGLWRGGRGAVRAHQPGRFAGDAGLRGHDHLPDHDRGRRAVRPCRVR